MELNLLLTDVNAMRDGSWTVVDAANFGDLEILSRGFTDEFVDAQAAMMQAARNELGLSPADALPNKRQRAINADLLRRFLVIDVKNLTNKGEPVTVEEFHAMLGNPNASRLARACWAAASKVSSRNLQVEEADAGN